jgi:hypothetical protein
MKNERQKQVDQIVFEMAETHLLKMPQVNSEILKLHLTSNKNRPSGLDNILHSLCSSLTNKQMHRNVFEGTVGKIDELDKILLDFDPHKIAKEYDRSDWNILMQDILKKGQLLKKPRITERSVVPQFCKGVLSAAYFLIQFKDYEEFYTWADFFDSDDRARVALPLLLSQEIHGVGFALACDFLKELGYHRFGKPDVHIKDIFRELNLMPNEKGISEDLLAFKSIQRIAENTGKTPYEVDKIFWLLGSGEFYKSDIIIPSQKKVFIENARKKLSDILSSNTQNK